MTCIPWALKTSSNVLAAQKYCGYLELPGMDVEVIEEASLRRAVNTSGNTSLRGKYVNGNLCHGRGTPTLGGNYVVKCVR